jgi:hypothetical protein
MQHFEARAEALRQTEGDLATGLGRALLRDR